MKRKISRVKEYRWLLLGLSCFLITLMLSVFSFYRCSSEFKWFNRANHLTDSLNVFLVRLTTLQSLARTYALIGEPSLVTDFHHLETEVFQELDSFEEMVQKLNAHSALVKDLRTQVVSRIAFLNRLIKMRTEHGLNGAIADIKTGDGNAAMNKVNFTITAIQNAQAKLLKDRYQEFKFNIFFFLFASLGGSSLSTALLLMSFRKTHSELKQRIATEARLNEIQTELTSRDKLLTSIFDSVVDGIIVAEKDGVILSWNRAAEKIFGYNSFDMVGKKSDVLVEHISENSDLTRNPSHLVEIVDPQLIGKFREYYARRKDDVIVPIEVTISKIEHDDKTIFVAVTRDLSERKSIESERIGRIAAESASAAKSQFLANVSHELRTPMGIIIGYSELLSKSSVTDAERVEYTSSLLRNSKHLLALLNDVLDISKVESGQVTFEKKLLPLPSFISVLIAQEQFVAQRKGIFLTSSFETDIPELIFTDELRLRQILMNLLSNAIKFTSRGYVSVKISHNFINDTNDSILQFEVIDTGCGIDKRHHEPIFEPFNQADSSISRQYGGTGLGLGLARKMARHLGGDVFLKWSEPNKGSSFVVSIELGENEKVGQLTPERAQDYSQTKNYPFSFDDRGPSVSLKGIKVLVTDDFEDNQLLIATYLRSSGADVESASNGIEAIEKFKRGDIDIILMDIQMPLMNGHEAFSKIRELDSRIPVIALTAHAMEDERRRCKSAGFSEYLAKPVSCNVLTSTILSLVNAARQRGPENVQPSDLGNGLSRPNGKFPSTLPPSFAALLREYKNKLPSRVGAMREFASKEDWNQLKRIAHQLRGTGGGYGLPEITLYAGKIEDHLRDFPNPRRVEELLECLEEVCKNAARTADI